MHSITSSLQLLGILTVMVLAPIAFGHALRRAGREERRVLPARFFDERRAR